MYLRRWLRSSGDCARPVRVCQPIKQRSRHLGASRIVNACKQDYGWVRSVFGSHSDILQKVNRSSKGIGILADASWHRAALENLLSAEPAMVRLLGGQS